MASDEINYRRFFDINDLAAIRMEMPEVFEETHRLVFQLLGEGRVTGLRIDHPDGLWNPAEYFHQLQMSFARLRGAGKGRPAEKGDAGEGVAVSGDGKGAWGGSGENGAPWPLYVVAEKILGEGEASAGTGRFTGRPGTTSSTW